MASCRASTCLSRGAPSRREIQLTKGAVVAADLADAQRARAARATRASADEQRMISSSFFQGGERERKKERIVMSFHSCSPALSLSLSPFSPREEREGAQTQRSLRFRGLALSGLTLDASLISRSLRRERGVAPWFPREAKKRARKTSVSKNVVRHRRNSQLGSSVPLFPTLSPLSSSKSNAMMTGECLLSCADVLSEAKRNNTFFGLASKQNKKNSSFFPSFFFASLFSQQQTTPLSRR